MDFKVAYIAGTIKDTYDSHKAMMYVNLHKQQKIHLFYVVYVMIHHCFMGILSMCC